MSDIIVSVPGKGWADWLIETVETPDAWDWHGSAKVPPVEPGDWIYVAALGSIQGHGAVKKLEFGDIKPAAWSGGRPSRRWVIHAIGWTPLTKRQPFISLATWVHASNFIGEPVQ